MNSTRLAIIIAVVLLLATGCGKPASTPPPTSGLFSIQSFNHIDDRTQYDFTLELPAGFQKGEISIECTAKAVLEGRKVLVLDWELDVTKEFKDVTSTSTVLIKVWATADGEIVQGEVRGEAKSGTGIERYLVIPYLASRQLSPGDRFTISGASLGESKIELIAGGIESVSTPAGTFSAMRLTASGSLDLTIYVSPEVPGGIIKLDMEKGGERGEVRSIVLTSYNDAT